MLELDSHARTIRVQWTINPTTKQATTDRPFSHGPLALYGTGEWYSAVAAKQSSVKQVDRTKVNDHRKRQIRTYVGIKLAVENVRAGRRILVWFKSRVYEYYFSLNQQCTTAVQTEGQVATAFESPNNDTLDNSTCIEIEVEVQGCSCLNQFHRQPSDDTDHI